MSQQLSRRSFGAEDQDLLFDCLAHPARRALLRRLRDQDEPIHIADLAQDLAAADADEAPLNGNAERDRENLYVALHHCHIPKLADADLVSYDHERKTVTVTATSQRLEAVVTLLARLE